jgi:hypothetical protein
MKPWQIIALMTLPVLLIGGLYLYHVEQVRNAPVTVHPAYVKRNLTDDETVVPKKLFIDSVPSAKVLVGKPVWLQAGYQVDYYPYRAGRIDFAKPLGVLPGMQECIVKNVLLQATPANFTSRLGRGNRNIFMIFTEPGSPDEYAATMGIVGGPGMSTNESRYYFDDLLYYDDPHQLYHFWPADVWKAVDAHQVIPGMNELQTTMSLGQIQDSDSKSYGDRTVHFHYGARNEKTASVTFVGNKATTVKAQ